MRQHNQRLYRIARSILRNEAEAEDIVQDAFVKAFTEIESLRDGTSIGAWLAKITVNLSISRLRRARRHEQVMPLDGQDHDTAMADPQRGLEADPQTPEQAVAMGDIRKLLEQAIDRLPAGFRETFVLRVVEQMSVQETSDALDIRPETVKTRLHRAKAMLIADLHGHLTAASLTAFPFGGRRCEQTTQAVLARLISQGTMPIFTNSETHH